MAKLPLHTWQGTSTAQVDVADWLANGPVNQALLYAAMTIYRTNLRHGLADTKTRGEVRGGGKKPWKQKGTGRAQVGSSRTPLWRHGGTVHGPRSRSYDFKLSKKVERGALRAALAQKMKDGDLVVVDALAAAEIKTKAAVEMLKRLGVAGKAVLVDVAADEKLSRSLRNIPGVSLVPSARLTARDVIDAGRVVATRGALEKLQEALS